MVEYQGQEIATLRYDKDSEGMELVFPNGTVQPAAAFFEDFLREMETTWADYLDDSELDFDAVQGAVSKFDRP